MPMDGRAHLVLDLPLGSRSLALSRQGCVQRSSVDTLWPAALGGVFALLGVAVQYTLASRGQQEGRREERRRALLERRLSAYTQLIVDGRRVQRALKDEALQGDRTAESGLRVRQELDRLALSVATVRLLAGPEVSAAAQNFEDEARDAQRLEPRVRTTGDPYLIRLGPLIEILRGETESKD